MERIQSVVSQTFPKGTLILSCQKSPYSRQELYEIVLERDGEQKTVFYKRNTKHWTWWSEHDREKTRREGVALRHVRQFSEINVPKCYAYGEDWLLVSKIEGIRPLSAKECYSDVRVAQKMANVLAELHQIPLPSGPFPRVTTSSVIATLHRWARRSGNLRLQKVVERLRPFDEEGEIAFLHGDLNLGNFLLDEFCQISGIIDWEDSAIGDVRFDLFTPYWFLNLVAPDLAAPFLETYQELTGTKIKNFAKWYALISVRAWGFAELVRSMGEPPLRIYSTVEEMEEVEKLVERAGF